MFFFISIIFLLILEILIFITINIFKKDFQWLITNEDEYPFFSNEKLEKFYKNTYDSELGWDRKKIFKRI